MPVARSMVLLLGLAWLVLGGVAPVRAAEEREADATDAVEPETGPAPAAPSAGVLRVPVQRDSTGTSYVAPTLEVRGRRVDPQRRLDRATPFATVLDRSGWAGQARSAADVLGRAVGVSVRDTGGLGSYSTVSLRGSSAAQVPVYLDGVLLNGPESGEVNLADLSLAHLDRIEVYRGSAPLVLGGGSLGGAIHLFSAAGRGAPLRMALGHGTHDSWNGELAAAFAPGEWTVHLRARGVRSDGDWEYLDDRGTLYNPDDDEVRPRANNDVRGGGVLLGASRPWRGGTLRFGEMIDLREQGLPGHGVLRSSDARSHSLTHQFRAGWAAPRARGGLLRGAQLFHRTEIQGVRDPRGSLGRSPRDRTDRLHVVGASASGAVSTFGERLWRLETNWSRLRSHDAALRNGDESPKTRWTASAALQPHLRWFDDRLLVSPGVRVQWHHQRWEDTDVVDSGPVRESFTTRTAQIGVRFALGPELDLKANLGVFQRSPTLLELFGDRGTAQGNPALRPESGTNRDVGLVWSRPAEGRRLALSVFLNDAFDLITFVKTSPVTARAFNVGRAEIRGLEFEADLGRFGPWSLRSSFTRLSTRDLTDDAVAGGKQLPGRPGYEIEVRPGLHVGPLDLGASLFALGDNYAQTGERAPVPSRVLFGLDARWELRPQLALLARVDNLGSQEVFDLWGYPLPRRQLTISVQAGVFGGR